jgi:hypothetical protein
MFGAWLFYGQAVGISILSQRFMYFFLFYFLLHHLKIPPKEIIRLILALGLIYSFLYLLQTFLYPTPITTSDMWKARGTIRIFMPGSAYLILAYLYAFTQFLNTFRIRYMLLCFLGLVIFILLGTRQVLATMALLTIIATLLSKRITSKAIGAVLITASIIPAFFLFKDVFTALFEVTQKQMVNVEQNVRVRAALFFLYEFFPNKLAYIIGNGVPSAHSTLGLKIDEYKEAFGFFQSDIGLIGDYTKFGILFVVAELTIMFRILFMKLHPNLMFIKLFTIGMFLTLFTGKGAFGAADNIVFICLFLYLIDVYKDKRFLEEYAPGEA